MALNMNQAQMEYALDHGELYAEMSNGRWWKIRRNGKTKTWKTRPGEFQIPIKAGLKSYGYLDHTGVGVAHRDQIPANLRSA